MWIFTTAGFLSVVADREHAGNLLVRARARGDIGSFAEQAGAPTPSERPDRDYRWRTSVSASTFAAWLAAQGEAIDYANFKNAVAERQGHDRAHRYAEVWTVMNDLQTDEILEDEARRARFRGRMDDLEPRVVSTGPGISES